MEKNTQKVDLVGVYISSVLVPRLNRADTLYEQERYVEAADKLIQVIKTLYRVTPEEKKKISNWSKKLDTILQRASKVEGRAACFTAQKRVIERHRLAKNFYDEMLDQIWTYLHELGYFAPNKSYGLTRNQLNVVEVQEE